MKYIVVINANSAIGRGYANLFPAARVGQEIHVAMTCTEMNADNPHYMFVRTEPTPQGATHQALHLPHGNVLFVIQYSEDEKPPAGFF